MTFPHNPHKASIWGDLEMIDITHPEGPKRGKGGLLEPSDEEYAPLSEAEKKTVVFAIAEGAYRQRLDAAAQFLAGQPITNLSVDAIEDTVGGLVKLRRLDIESGLDCLIAVYPELATQAILAIIMARPRKIAPIRDCDASDFHRGQC